MKRILVVVFLAMLIQRVHSAEPPTSIDRPAADAGPTEVSVGIWIVDITNIDSAQQSFTADVAIVLRWKDARLAHTGTGVAHYALDQIWTPRVSIANETSSVVRKLPESAEVEPDGTVLYRQRYVGSNSIENRKPKLITKNLPTKRTSHFFRTLKSRTMCWVGRSTVPTDRS